MKGAPLIFPAAAQKPGGGVLKLEAAQLSPHPPLVPWVAGVDGLAVGCAAEDYAGFFKALFVGVVAVLAEGLPVGVVPEEARVTVVGVDVVDD